MLGRCPASTIGKGVSSDFHPSPGSPIQTRGRCLRPGVSCFAKKPPPKKGSGGAAPRDGGGGFAPAQPPRPPPRIIDTSVLSLKTQKRLIEQRKKQEQAAAGGRAFVAQRFRKPKLDADEYAAEEERKRQELRASKAEQERRRKARKALVDMLKAREAGEKPAVLIVDGYNVVMQRLQLEAGAGAAAAAAVAARRACMADERERLVDDTRDYALSLGCRATVVFDALGNPGRAATAREVVAGVEVVYPRDSDADLWIVREAAAARAEGAPRVVVVTGDTEVAAGLALTDATGAMPSDMYLLEMRRVAKQVDLAQKEAEEGQLHLLLSGGGGIAHGALRDEKTLESLTKLRRQLDRRRASSKSLFRLERW